MMRAESQLDRLAAALSRLAATSDEQREYLEVLGVGGLTDELALEFDDALLAVRHQLGALGLPSLVVAGVDSIAAQLSSMSRESDDDALWRPEALDRPEWSRVRDLAAEVLEAIAARNDGSWHQ